MKKSRKKKLYALARLMNRQNDPSVFISRELIHVFDLVIPDDEADLLLAMGTGYHLADTSFLKSGMDRETFDSCFASALGKGLIWMKRDEEGEEVFGVAPILVGWFEVFLFNGRQTETQKEFARRLDDLFFYWQRFNVFPVRNLRNLKQRFAAPTQRILPALTESSGTRRIDLNLTVRSENATIAGTDRVISLLERYGADNEIVLVNCFCREWHAMVGRECSIKLPHEGCIVIGDFAMAAARYFGGRIITTEEAKDLVESLRRKGAVHMIFHERENIGKPEIAICNCCRDCCGILGTYNRGITGLTFRTSGFSRITNPGNCNLCGNCTGICPVFALSTESNCINLQEDLCIGCGQCIMRCHRDVFRFEEDDRTVILPLLKPSKVNIRRQK